uniref:FERM domain-containing protein n=2 Tax=Ciona intestinalis TaxID=7719 RepID=F6XNI1_CIOIN
CRANVLSAIPYKKKQQAVTSREHSIVAGKWNHFSVGDNQGDNSPPYQRRRASLFTVVATAPACGQNLQRDRSNQPDKELGNCKPADCKAVTVADTDRLKPIVFESRTRNSTVVPVIYQEAASGKRAVFDKEQQKLQCGRRERALAAIMKSNSGKKPVRVHLLTGDSILLVFDAKALVKDVFDQVCTMYSIKESHFFGLSAVIENEHRFMDTKQRLSKYAPKEWGKDLKRRASDLSV